MTLKSYLLKVLLSHPALPSVEEPSDVLVVFDLFRVSVFFSPQVIHKHFYLKRTEIMSQCEEWIADIQQYSSDKRVGRTMSHHAAALKVRPLHIPSGVEMHRRGAALRPSDATLTHVNSELALVVT